MKNLKRVRCANLEDFLSTQKLPYFLPLELSGFFRQIFVDLRVLSNSASNFLINQTRNPDPGLFGGGLKQPLCRARNRNVGGWGISQQAANWLTPRDTDLLKYPCVGDCETETVAWSWRRRRCRRSCGWSETQQQHSNLQHKANGDS